MATVERKPNQRERQKNATAELFRKTARRLFHEYGYLDVSVDQIAELAGTSRATFYLHFQGKREILISLLEEDFEAQITVYEELAAIPELSWLALRAWLGRFRQQVERLQASLPLFSFAFEGRVERSPISIAHRDRAIDVIGRRFEAFDIAAAPAELKSRKRARAFMMIMAMEQVALDFSFAENSPSISDGLDLLTDHLYAYLHEGERARALRSRDG